MQDFHPKSSLPPTILDPRPTSATGKKETMHTIPRTDMPPPLAGTRRTRVNLAGPPRRTQALCEPKTRSGHPCLRAQNWARIRTTARRKIKSEPELDGHHAPKLDEHQAKTDSLAPPRARTGAAELDLVCLKPPLHHRRCTTPLLKQVGRGHA
jgi:hypothetical protein